MVNDAAVILASKGVKARMRVAILSRNSLEYLRFCFGLMALGAESVNLNWRQPVAVLAESVKLAKCSMLIVSDGYVQDGDVIKRIASLPQPLVLGDLHAIDAASLPPQQLAVEKRSDRVAAIFFTSGSTSTPKGVPHSHEELLWLAHKYLEVLDRGKPLVGGGSLCLFPFFHVMGFVHNMIYNLYVGQRVVIHKETATTAITAELMLQALVDTKPTAINTVPWIVEEWCGLLEKGDEKVQAIKSLTYMSYGGAALPEYCVDILTRHKIKVLMSYGQTEVGAAVMFTRLGGSLRHMELFPGVTYTLAAEDDGDSGDSVAVQVDQSPYRVVRSGELILFGQYSTCKGYLPGSNSRPLAVGDSTTYDMYKTGDIFEEVEINGELFLGYKCRHDDLVVHKTGEMSHPIPTEQSIKTECSEVVDQIIMFGQGRTNSLLAIQLHENVADPKAVANTLWAAIEQANAKQPSYSAITHDSVIILQPGVHAEKLPTTNKGNVQRKLVEKMFDQELRDTRTALSSPSKGLLLQHLLHPDTLAMLEDNADYNSLSVSSKVVTNPLLVKQFHAYAVGMLFIVMLHMAGMKAPQQHSPFMVAAHARPLMLNGLARGGQVVALPVFMFFMGLGDYYKYHPKRRAFSLIWRELNTGVQGLGRAIQLTRPLLMEACRPLGIWIVCRWMLPIVAGYTLHPFFALGKGGHFTFTWVFLFMFYARLMALFFGFFRFPKWAFGVVALAVHFGCYGGLCPSPLSRSYRVIGFLPRVLNCPRLSVYLPFYASAPLLLRKRAVTNRILEQPRVKIAAAVCLCAVLLWGCDHFNADFSSLGNMPPYGCPKERSPATPPCKRPHWTRDAFIEDLGLGLVCFCAVAFLVALVPRTPTVVSQIGQRSFVALILHLYAIFALAKPYQQLIQWVSLTITPWVLPAVTSVAWCAAVLYTCSVPFTIDAKGWPRPMHPRIFAVAACMVGVLLVPYVQQILSTIL